jgi:hypothetical protein
MPRKLARDEITRTEDVSMARAQGDEACAPNLRSARSAQDSVAVLALTLLCSGLGEEWEAAETTHRPQPTPST